jgi:hypothetical protein
MQSSIQPIVQPVMVEQVRALMQALQTEALTSR